MPGSDVVRASFGAYRSQDRAAAERPTGSTPAPRVSMAVWPIRVRASPLPPMIS